MACVSSVHASDAWEASDVSSVDACRAEGGSAGAASVGAMHASAGEGIQIVALLSLCVSPLRWLLTLIVCATASMVREVASRWVR